MGDNMAEQIVEEIKILRFVFVIRGVGALDYLHSL
jgi:hypothetical protein